MQPAAPSPTTSVLTRAARLQIPDRLASLPQPRGLPWLCWQTSSLSLVSLAAMDGDPARDEHPTRQWHADLNQVLGRLQRAAAALDWPIFATLHPRETGSLWLVMGASADTTTVLQRDDHAPIELPLTLQLMRRRDGGCEARWHETSALIGHGLPDSLIAQVARLPRLLDQAWH